MATEHKIGGMQESIRATPEMTMGMVEQIKHDAMARTVTMREEVSRLEISEKNSTKSDGPARGDSTARVYGDMAVEALIPGSKVLTSVAEFLGDRKIDKGIDVSGRDAHTAGIVSPHARTIEEDIGRVNMSPGLYRVSAPQSIYGETASASAQNFSAPSKITDQALGATISERGALAGMSLKDQGKDAIKSWDVEEKSGKFNSVKYARELTASHEMANEAAFNSAKVVEAQHGGMMFKASQMSPGLSMANGPSFNPSKVLVEAEELWKQGGRVA